MAENYRFTIQNTRAKQIRLLANLILFLNAFAFIYFGMHASNKQVIVIGALTAIIALIDAIVNRSWKIHLAAAVLVVIGWINIGYWWIGIIMPVLSAFAQLTANNKSINFNTKEIKLSSPFGKTFNWLELQNIILKDGLLTLDFKNNKLLQTPILDELNEAETKQFNDFCSKQLAADS
jgi:hypothetical protein